MTKAIAGELVRLRFKLKFMWIQTPHFAIAPTWRKSDHAQGQERMGLPKAKHWGSAGLLVIGNPKRRPAIR